MAARRKDIILAYRHIYRQSLRAVQFSKPSRYTVRDRIRNAFRNSSEEDYDPERIARTLEFINGAVGTKGLEHTIIKNLTVVWWGQQKLLESWPRKEDLQIRRTAYDQFNQTIEKLNETMGLCIK